MENRKQQGRARMEAAEHEIFEALGVKSLDDVTLAQLDELAVKWGYKDDTPVIMMAGEQPITDKAEFFQTLKALVAAPSILQVGGAVKALWVKSGESTSGNT